MFVIHSFRFENNEFSIFHAARHRVAMVYIYIYTQWTMVALHNSRNVGRKTYIISNDKCAIFFSTFLSTWSRCNTRPAVPLQSCIDDRLDYTVIYIYILLFPFLHKIETLQIKARSEINRKPLVTYQNISSPLFERCARNCSSSNEQYPK